MRYILSCGSNLGNRESNLKKGIKFLFSIGKIISSSSVYETSPVGMTGGTRPFYNSIVVLDSDQDPEEMLKKIKQFEEKMGRDTENSHMKPRQLDIDILFADELIINTPHLTIPHPEITNRKFVLKPLNEILPEFRHPVSGKIVRDLLTELNSDENVRLTKAFD